MKYLMRVVRLTDVNQRQHHEHKGLQRNDDDVKHRPRPTRHNLHTEQRHASRFKRYPRTTQQGDQHKYQFASIHIAKQSHAV